MSEVKPRSLLRTIASKIKQGGESPAGRVAGSRDGWGVMMKCIAVVDSNHSLMNFKLFGERGGAYRIDCDDATASERENQYYTIVEKEDAESMLKWLIDAGVKELPSESVRWLFYYILNNEDKDGYALEDYMIAKRLWRLPYFQRTDGRILSYRLDEGEEVWVIVNGETHRIAGDLHRKTILTLFLEKFGKFEPFHIVSNVWYNEKLQQWETWESPIVYKFQAPKPYLVKRFEEDNEMNWNFKSAGIEYGWSVDHQSAMLITGEQVREKGYAAQAFEVREWAAWM